MTAFVSDPSGASALDAAILWLEALLLGTVATAIAVIAVGALGFAMLSGRIDLRRSVTVVIGCFILFGAPAIAAGMLSAIRSDTPSAGDQAPIVDISPFPPPVPVARTVPAPSPNAYDPYAGASVPN